LENSTIPCIFCLRKSEIEIAKFMRRFHFFGLEGFYLETVYGDLLDWRHVCAVNMRHDAGRR
jgi:hypothetical protein